MNDRRSWAGAIAKGAFLLLTLAMLCGVVYLLHNVLHAIILGVLFATLLMPINTFFLRRVLAFRRWLRKVRRVTEPPPRHALSRERSIAAMLTVCVVCVCLVVPLTMFGASILHQGYAATTSAQRWIVSELPGTLRSFVEKHHLQERFDALNAGYRRLVSGELFTGTAGEPPVPADASPAVTVSADASPVTAASAPVPAKSSGTGRLDSAVARLTGLAVQQLRDILLLLLSRAGIFVFNFCIMLFVMYQIFFDGRRIMAYLKRISPLGDEEQRRVTQRIREVSRAVFFGIFGTALAQGICASICFEIVGISLFWGVILGICSIVPVVGTSVIWIPVTAYLYLTGQYGGALFVFLSCGCVIANFDMMLRPLLMKRSGETGMSYMVLFLSLMGGIQTFGLVGVIYGPLITGICSICLLIFSTQFKESGRRKGRAVPEEGVSDGAGNSPDRIVKQGT